MPSRLLHLAFALVMLASGMAPATAWVGALEDDACRTGTPRTVASTHAANAAGAGTCEGRAGGRCCCGNGGSCCVERPAVPAPRPDADSPRDQGSSSRSSALAPAILAAALCTAADLPPIAGTSLAAASPDAGAARGFAASPSERRRHLRHAVFLA